MEEDKSVILSIDWGEGSKTIHKITRAIAAQVVMLAEVGQSVRALHDSKSIMPTGASVQIIPGSQKIAPREALSKSGAKTFPQKVAVLGLYQVNMTGRESFTPAEIQALLKRSGETPANFSRDFSAAERQFGYILQNQVGEYELTDLGKEAATKGFETTSQVNGRKRRTNKKNKAKKVDSVE